MAKSKNRKNHKKRVHVRGLKRQQVRKRNEKRMQIFLEEIKAKTIKQLEDNKHKNEEE